MKKILSLLVLLVMLTSCEEDVKFNTPAVQGFKNNELWRATEYTATINANDFLTIQATNGFESLVLRTGAIDAGVYELGLNETNKASFTFAADGVENDYQTGAGVGAGEIEISNRITETNIAAGFISGTFNFNAVSDDGAEVYFQEGFFYKVPVVRVP